MRLFSCPFLCSFKREFNDRIVPCHLHTRGRARFVPGHRAKFHEGRPRSQHRLCGVRECSTSPGRKNVTTISLYSLSSIFLAVYFGTPRLVIGATDWEGRQCVLD